MFKNRINGYLYINNVFYIYSSKSVEKMKGNEKYIRLCSNYILLQAQFKINHSMVTLLCDTALNWLQIQAKGSKI